MISLHLIELYDYLEAEERVIQLIVVVVIVIKIVTEVRDNGRTLLFNEPLLFDHYGGSETFDGVQVNMASEVGLLSRNVVPFFLQTSE